MCSTPWPKKMAIKRALSSIMTSMDEEARHHFTERANQVTEKEEAVRKEKRAHD